MELAAHFCIRDNEPDRLPIVVHLLASEQTLVRPALRINYFVDIHQQLLAF
jgi:hypothetical protein